MSKDVKPIFVVRVPMSAGQQGLQEINKKINSQLEDYHVLVASTLKDDIEFEVFYPEDFDEVKMEEIKDKILGQVKEVEEKGDE